MRSREFLRRVGMGEERADPRFAWRIVLGVCALYAVAFFAFYPDVVTNDDEGMYVRHARLLLDGRSTITQLDAMTGEPVEYRPSRYPIGTALWMAPFVAVFGWKGGFLAVCASLFAGVLLLAHWLRQEGRSPLWALLVLGFPPALVLGRVAMSDVPSFAFVTLGLWLFWRGLDRGWPWWLASGFVAGASMNFRESNPIVFAPFFAGTVLRREWSCWALVAGGLAGLGTRLLANALVFGDPFFYKAAYIFDLSTLWDRLPIYLLAVLVFVPGGFVLALCYRGRRWPELTAAVALFVLAYVVQEYYMWGTTQLKLMILTPRYMLPIVPVMALGMAEAIPRLWRRLQERSAPSRRPTLQAAAAALLAVWIGGVALAAVAVHPVFYGWSAGQGQIRTAIERKTDPDSPLVTNRHLTRKFIPLLDLKYALLEREWLSFEDAASIVDRIGRFYVALIDRNDGATGLRHTAANAEFMASLEPLEPALLLDREISPTTRLRIWRVERAPSDS